MTEIKKRGYQTAFSYESIVQQPSLDMHTILRVNLKAAALGLRRQVDHFDIREPDPADVAEYKRLEAMYDEIRASDLWREDYDGGWLEKPETKRTPVYAESDEEFAARVDHAYAEAMSHRGQGYPFGGHP